MKPGRPEFKPTKPQRERVKVLKADGWPNERIAKHLGISRNTLEKCLSDELEFGADAKQVEILEAAHKAAKKGNASMIKFLVGRHDLARAAERVADRENLPAAPTEQRPTKDIPLGKKEQRQQEAEAVTGKFAPPPAPTRH